MLKWGNMLYRTYVRGNGMPLLFTSPSTYFTTLSPITQRIRMYPTLMETFKFGVLFTSAEIIQQVFTRKLLDSSDAKATLLDWGSVGRYFIWGFFVFPHVLRQWYKFIDSTFIGKTWPIIIKKTLVDQTLFPLPILGSFYIFLSILEGKTGSFQEVSEECRIKLKTTLFARYCFMVPAQIINFAFIPSNRRVVYVGVVTFFWLNILCILKSLSVDHTLFKRFTDK